MRLWNYFPTKKGEQLQKGRRKKRTRDSKDLPIRELNITLKKINRIQIGYLEFRTNLRSFRVIILVFRTISHYLNSKTELGPGLEQFQQIRTILRFLDPI